MKYIIMIALLLLVLLEYALMVAAHDADERAEEMYREWEEKDDE